MAAGESGTPLDVLDLVEGIGAICLCVPEGPVWEVRPDAPYPSPGLGRLALGVAFFAEVAAGRLDPAQRETLTRPADAADRGVLAALGAGLNPTMGDLMTLAIELEDPEATARLRERMGAAALRSACSALGMEPEAMAGYPAVTPQGTARGNAAAFARLTTPAAPPGSEALLRLLTGVRYRWRMRSGVGSKEDEIAIAGGRGARFIEDTALWRIPGGVCVFAAAITEADDPWRAEYVMGEWFRQAQARAGGEERS